MTRTTSRPLDALDRETIRTLLADKVAWLAPASVAAIANVLHTCLAEAVADGYIRSNPADGGGSRRGHARPEVVVKALTAPQLRAFLSAAGDWRPFFHISWALGLRPGEAMGLQPVDVDLTRQRVRVERTVRAEGGTGPTKTSGGWVDLAPEAALAIQRRMHHPDWLFPGRRGGPMDHVTVERAFKRILVRAGLPQHFTPHCLRHTFAAMLLQAGCSVYYVQRMLRHASIQVTVHTYGSWLDPGRPEHVAAMEVSVLSVGGQDVAASNIAPCPITL